MISGQTRYCFPTNVSSCITDSCGILEQQCLYEISLDDCEPSEEGDELAFLKETSRMVTEALNFNTNDMQSENQIETIFTRLEPNFCGIGINEDFLSTYGHVFGWAYPGPSFFVQQSTIGSRCNSLSSNTYVHELGKLELCSHHHSPYYKMTRERLNEQDTRYLCFIHMKRMRLLKRVAIRLANQKNLSGMVEILSVRVASFRHLQIVFTFRIWRARVTIRVKHLTL